MSNREIAISILNGMSEEQINAFIALFAPNDINAKIEKEKADDEYCLKLSKEYDNSTDKGNFTSLEKAAEICGVKLNELQD